MFLSIPKNKKNMNWIDPSDFDEDPFSEQLSAKIIPSKKILSFPEDKILDDYISEQDFDRPEFEEYGGSE